MNSKMHNRKKDWKRLWRIQTSASRLMWTDFHNFAAVSVIQRWRVVQMHTFMDFFDYFLSHCSGPLARVQACVISWGDKGTNKVTLPVVRLVMTHVWWINAHLFSVVYCPLQSGFNAISVNLCIWGRSPRSVCCIWMTFRGDSADCDSGLISSQTEPTPA